MEQVKALNVAIVGGGPGCKAIMDMIFAEKLDQLRMKLIGVTCTNPKAVGYRYAQEKGIYTTRDYRDLYKLKDLNMIIELTGREEVANEISRTKPDHVRLMDHVAARLFVDVFKIEEKRVAERKQAQEMLTKSDREKEAILNSMSEIVVYHDSEHRVLWTNRVAGESVGLPPDELVGRHCYEIWHQSDEACIGCPVVKARETGQPQAGEMNTPDGRVWFVRGYPVRDSNNNIVGVVEAALDITERKQSQEEILRKNALLDAINEVLQETLTCESDEDVARTCLAVAEELTESKFGFIGEVNQAGRFDTIAQRDTGWKACKIPKSDAVLMIRDMEVRGIWGRVLEDERSIIVNQPASHPDSVGTPAGHPAITCFLGVPLKDADKTTGMIGLASKESGYDLADQQAVEALSVAFMEALNRKRAEEAVRESEEKYKTLIESSLTGIFIHQDGKYVFVNDRFAEIHGYTPEELLGKEYLTLIPADERDTLAQIASARLRGEDVPERYEVQRLGKDGKTIWCEMMATRIEYGGRPAIMGNIIDISERKRALAATQERDETLSGIIASMTDPMSMIDNEHNIAWANSFARQLFGPDLVGKKCYSAYHRTDKPCKSCVVRECFEDGEVHEHETEVIAADGRRMVFWCTASVAGWHRDGRPKLVVEISRDITERKRAEETLKKSVHELQVTHDQAVIYAEELREQVIERKQAEEALQERKEALKAQAYNLEEVNTALKVLLRRREEDKTELEEKVLSNVKELILPYVQTLSNTRLDAKQMTYVGIIESNLNTIVSSFLQKLSSKYLGLTPKEIQVAGLVKEGKTSKEIAELLNVSQRAVEFHRENIRTKLGLKNKKANLRSYLLSFP